MIAFPNVSPEIINFSIAGAEFSIRWYAVSYLAGFFVAIAIMKFFLSKEKLWRFNVGPLDREQVDSMMTYLILGVIVGGRLGYVLFYNFEASVENPISIIRIWDGGMAFHGGFLGVAIATIVYCRFNGVLLWSTADLLALATGPGLLFGRLANFINVELWGRPTNLPWGVVFPGERAQDCPGVIGECARHPTQLYEAGLEGLLLFMALIMFAYFGSLRRPGLITGLFLLIYGASRYLVEFYRVPDPQFFSATNLDGFAYTYGEFGITMGQCLSLPMIFVGVLLIILKSKKLRMG
jgi:phosphatidylglycerol:prolipoprotein diacylglycerol transferase